MKNINKFPEPRELVKEFAAYVPGKSIEQVKNDYGLDTIVKLASNENLWGPSPEVSNAIKESLDELYFYPLPFPENLADTIASSHLRSNKEIIFSNGTDELIEMIARTYLEASDNIVVSENSFVRYKMAAELMGSKIKEISQQELVVDLDGLLKAIDDKTKIIFIDNPCNPTGTFVPADALEMFFKKLSKTDFKPLVVVDEAYYEYADSKIYQSAVSLEHSGLAVMVLRTFSKIYGLAALRIGYGIAPEEIISFLNRVKPPFNTNMLAQRAALAGFKDTKYIAHLKNENLKEKQFLYSELEKLNLKYIESQTNFILIELPEYSVKELCEYMLSNGVILRPLAGYNLDDYIRVTVGKREDNEKFLSILSEYIEKNR